MYIYIYVLIIYNKQVINKYNLKHYQIVIIKDILNIYYY